MSRNQVLTTNMHTKLPLLLWFLALLMPSLRAQDPTPVIPPELAPWQGWVTWEDRDLASPRPYDNPGRRIPFWPGTISFTALDTGAAFEVSATLFSEAWLPLPGSADLWPQDVKVNGSDAPVLERDGVPVLRLPPGQHTIVGSIPWSAIPQRILLPKSYGVVTLNLNGTPVLQPSWDNDGFLWLKRDASAEEADRDFLSVKAYGLLEDGIPMWLRMEVELIVSGKSREEDLGVVIPSGWKLAAVEAPIPVLIDEEGLMKVQVRAGRWVVRASAFRTDDPQTLAYAADSKPAVADLLLGFQSKPDFRMVEITGAPSVDISQTTFPQQWREFPVYQWETSRSLGIEQRMRGMGTQRPEGLRITREWWLDENGRGLTFRDSVQGSGQEIWRLDAAPGQQLGSVRSGEEGMLITRNPTSGAQGVEIRTRSIGLSATGRMERTSALSATGWSTDADGVGVTLHLPPGWRLLALFGADYVRGDWLTKWTLLDLFLLLIFTLAVFRLWGVLPAMVAFFAFGLAYHEPGAPRYIWLCLLLPLGLLRVVPEGWARRLIQTWKWATIIALVFVLAPFVASQVQQAIYPQLEVRTEPPPAPMGVAVFSSTAPAEMLEAPMQAADELRASEVAQNAYSEKFLWKGRKANLLFDAAARIQTGPGVPDWTWRSATFGWNGPVTASQQVRPILIPMPFERVLSVLRVILVLGLAIVLLRGMRLPPGLFGPMVKVSALLAACLLVAVPQAKAENFPPQEMLETLRKRLLETPPAFPGAAEIPHARLQLNGGRLSIEAEIHTAAFAAVPLPARLPTWSPVSVQVNGQPAAALRRQDGSLWVALEAGVHVVSIEGLLADVTEWEWTFQLRPRTVAIEAPDWTVSGIRPNGVPEAQVFFVRKQRTVPGEASYDRQELQSVAIVERDMELGLVWQARTTVRRLSPAGKALSLQIPLLPGENVLTPGQVIREGTIEVRLGAGQDSYSWDSELSPQSTLDLETRAEDSWVERWTLLVSPVWNVGISGLAPVFAPGAEELVPVWSPWPGESASLDITRPEAIPGATVTVSNVNHTVNVGSRQRTSTLDLTLRCSLGEDFLIGIPEAAEISQTTLNEQAIPVRRDAGRVIVPLGPGEQRVRISWRTNIPLGLQASVDPVILPVESANIRTALHVPQSRWVLWTQGPLRGPAVRFWTVLACSLLAAWVLGRLALSPLRTHEWILLSLGLTQVSLVSALVVVAWFFFLSWRGRDTFARLQPTAYNLLQIGLVLVTGISLLIFVAVVAAGLLGDPRMFITGNGSTSTALHWYLARSGPELPTPSCVTVSIWWYRLLMLLWALWLAASLIRWLRWGWQQFASGGLLRTSETNLTTPQASTSPTQSATPPDLP